MIDNNTGNNIAFDAIKIGMADVYKRQVQTYSRGYDSGVRIVFLQHLWGS